MGMELEPPKDVIIGPKLTALIDKMELLHRQLNDDAQKELLQIAVEQIQDSIKIARYTTYYSGNNASSIINRINTLLGKIKILNEYVLETSSEISPSLEELAFHSNEILSCMKINKDEDRFELLNLFRRGIKPQ